MNLPIVYYHHFATWESHSSRQHYLMEALSAHTQVIYLNPKCPSSRRFEVQRPSIRRISQTLTVIDNAFAFRASPLGRRIKRAATYLESNWLHRALQEIGIGRYAYWLSTPLPELLEGMNCDHLIYDCIDPCFDGNMAKYDRDEVEVAKRAHIVFCTAKILLERMQTIHPNSHLLPNACAPEDYDPQEIASLEPPPALAGRSKPVIGYMGSIDWRIDTALLTEAARRLPDCTFALVGRINSDQEKNLRGLQILPNVVMPGVVSLEEGRAYTAAFDVGLIPFRTGYIGDAINPVKMYMYLMAGKPVVSTWIRECRRHTPHVLAAQNADEFVCAIRQAATENSREDVARRMDFGLQNTWKVRAQNAVYLLSSLT